MFTHVQRIAFLHRSGVGPKFKTWLLIILLLIKLAQLFSCFLSCSWCILHWAATGACFKVRIPCTATLRSVHLFLSAHRLHKFVFLPRSLIYKTRKWGNRILKPFLKMLKKKKKKKKKTIIKLYDSKNQLKNPSLFGHSVI